MPAPATQALLAALDTGWDAQPTWTVLDTDFGKGQRFLALWRHWRQQPRRPALLHVVALLAPDEALALPEALKAAPPPDTDAARELGALSYGLDGGFHRILLDDGRVSLTLCVGSHTEALAQQVLQADTVWATPEAAWDKWQLKALARCCRRGARVLFAGTQPPAPELLSAAGFVPDAEAGTALPQALFAPRWKPRTAAHASQASGAGAPLPGRCAVVGAGLAGAAVARALALRGWQVDVYDQAAQPAGGASGLPAGLVVPLHSTDNSPRSRMSRGGTRLMLQHLRVLLREGQDWGGGGVLERDVGEEGLADVEAEMHSGSASGPAQPGAWAWPVEGGTLNGLWHPYAAWVKPGQLVRAWLDHGRIRFHGGAAVHDLQHTAPSPSANGPAWQLRAADGRVLGEADTVVLANAHGVAALQQRVAAALPPDHPWADDVAGKLQALQVLHGTLSLGPCPAELAAVAGFPQHPVNGHGSFVSRVPTAQGLQWYAGSTFRRGASPTDLAAEHAANRAKLAALLPDVALALAPQFEGGDVQAWQASRCVSFDRLPLVGPLEDTSQPTLWICAGMGARGLSFSALCAELLAAMLGHEPLPLEDRLARALDSRRRRRVRAAAKPGGLAPMPPQDG